MIYLAGMIILNLPFEIGNTQYETTLISLLTIPVSCFRKQQVNNECWIFLHDLCSSGFFWSQWFMWFLYLGEEILIQRNKFFCYKLFIEVSGKWDLLQDFLWERNLRSACGTTEAFLSFHLHSWKAEADPWESLELTKEGR